MSKIVLEYGDQHTKFNCARNRVGDLPTLDEIMVSMDAIKAYVESETPLAVKLTRQGAEMIMMIEDDLKYMQISQHHFYPQALIHRELGNKSHLKNLDLKRVIPVIKRYFDL
ncbi:hypothetical protein [Neptuniibacter sp. QD37_11]|uniref:hypothetical protein n=1 Tax=Neptuniibacter sp. QD37_11 TaxID=3398209 RepID=UPI0039F4CA29